jgi:two-component system NarL family sensor kinase
MGGRGEHGLLVLVHAVTPGQLDGEYAVVVNPFGIDPALGLLRPLRDVGWGLLAVNGVAAMASLVARMRTAKRRERQELLWMTATAGIAVAVAALWGLTVSGEEAPTPVVPALFLVTLVGLPAVVTSAAARTEALRRSVERLVLAREEERLRIRRDLHDGLGPTLAAVALQVEAVRRRIHDDPEGADSMLDRVVGQVRAGIADIRRLVNDLRPPILDQLGLVAAIQEATTSFSEPDGAFNVTVKAKGNFADLPAAIEVAAFRIVMEAVNNARRHGRAATCQVRLSAERTLEITVEDDGVGVAVGHTPGVGLTSMRDRAVELGGTWDLSTELGTGTVVRAGLPLPGR